MKNTAVDGEFSSFFSLCYFFVLGLCCRGENAYADLAFPFLYIGLMQQRMAFIEDQRRSLHSLTKNRICNFLLY